jgi:hypothetical protein
MSQVYNAHSELEDAEYGVASERNNIFDEMARIGHRQFEWQAGHNATPHVYRSMYLFGGPTASTYFANKHGISPSDFALAGFSAWSGFLTGPFLVPPFELPHVGLTAELFRNASRLIALPIPDIRKAAVRIRRGHGRVAYKASVLRRHPAIVCRDGVRLGAPLPSLVLTRITKGLYYDMVEGGENVKNEIGDRFEEYCRDLIRLSLPETSVTPPVNYGTKKSPIYTPDIRISVNGKISLVVECKAKRMTMAARFGEDPLNEAKDGFKEIAKGVFQLWRYFSHVRQGKVHGDAADADAVGLVLTLDPWLVLTSGRYEALLAQAGELAAQVPDILELDRKPIAFCDIEDFERLLRRATYDSLIGTLQKAATVDFAGWHVTGLHDDLFPESKTGPFVFRDRIAELLPWWGLVGD